MSERTSSMEDLLATGQVFTLGSPEHKAHEAAIEHFSNMSAEDRLREMMKPEADLEKHFERPIIPSFEEGEWGSWIVDVAYDAMARGYFNGLRMTRECWRLRRGGKTWMSIMPIELESQMPHIHVASGVVVNCGLGMGFSTLNFARKPEVTEVHVVELDPDVLELFFSASDFDQWPEEWRRKIKFHNQSAFDPIPGVREVDFLFADIWVSMCEDGFMEDARRIVAQYDRVSKVGVWTQEMDFIHWLMKMEPEDRCRLDEVDADVLARWAADRGLPLIGAEMPFYWPWFENVAINMINY